MDVAQIPQLDTLESRQNLCHDMARDAHTFDWDTSFPEPGLSKALSLMHQNFEDNRENSRVKLRPGLDLLMELMQARVLFSEYHVPAAQVEGRFDRMGLGYYWRATRSHYEGCVRDHL
ncbi:hypothetical protein BDZ89DRAFT_1070809 [Hymenopellis radicata]|nr:hypothetical protein BDZ89DRAFT_1070809 [Hymenopellis radicata]